MKQKACFSCGALVPDKAGPTHKYLLSSPGCWAIYGEVLAREYSDPAYFPVRRLTVDAYALQHPGDTSAQAVQSVAVHLSGLLLIFERSYTYERATEAMKGLTKLSFHWLKPPDDLGTITVRDVLLARSAKQHQEVVRRWAGAAYTAWEEHHPQVRRWLL